MNRAQHLLVFTVAMTVALWSANAFADCANPQNDPDVQRGCDTYEPPPPPSPPDPGSAGNGAGVGVTTVHGCEDDGCWHTGPDSPAEPESSTDDTSSDNSSDDSSN
jgi:hypothetical protein